MNFEIFIKSGVNVAQYDGTASQTRNFFELIRGKSGGICDAPDGIEFDDQLDRVVVLDPTGTPSAIVDTAAKTAAEATKLAEAKTRLIAELKAIAVSKIENGTIVHNAKTYSTANSAALHVQGLHTLEANGKGVAGGAEIMDASGVMIPHTATTLLNLGQKIGDFQKSVYVALAAKIVEAKALPDLDAVKNYDRGAGWP